MSHPIPTNPPMNRTWWKHIQTIAPLSLEACTGRFADKHPRDWRARIQRTPELAAYFYEMYKLELHTSKIAGGAQPYGYRLVGRHWKVNRNRYYTSAEEAMWAGLAVAFALVETEARRVPYVSPTVHQPVRREPKDEKKNLPEEDWRRAVA